MSESALNLFERQSFLWDDAENVERVVAAILCFYVPIGPFCTVVRLSYIIIIFFTTHRVMVCFGLVVGKVVFALQSRYRAPPSLLSCFVKSFVITVVI